MKVTDVKVHLLSFPLKEKFTFIGIGKGFMEKLSLVAEERLSLSKAKKILFGGDGDS